MRLDYYYGTAQFKLDICMIAVVELLERYVEKHVM